MLLNWKINTNADKKLKLCDKVHKIAMNLVMKFLIIFTWKYITGIIHV